MATRRPTGYDKYRQLSAKPLERLPPTREIYLNHPDLFVGEIYSDPINIAHNTNLTQRNGLDILTEVKGSLFEINIESYNLQPHCVFYTNCTQKVMESPVFSALFQTTSSADSFLRKVQA
jgi:hypothetical protein